MTAFHSSVIEPATDYTVVKIDINSHLNTFFTARTLEAEGIHPRYVDLWTAMRAVALGGGKRIRPYLTVVGYEVCGGQNYDMLLPVAMSQELLQLSLLIHDDIMDRDYVRHGVSNVAGQFREEYLRVTTNYSASHYADAAALIAGDLLLSAAHVGIMQADFDDSLRQKAHDIFRRSIVEVAAGQFLENDMQLMHPEQIDSQLIARYKTASYTTIGPLLCGAVLANADAKTIQALQSYGTYIGTAYQLADDLLGLFGDERQTGKSNISDIREGKRTYLIEQTLLHASNRERSIIEAALGNQKLTRHECDAVREIVIRTGGDTVTRKLIDTFMDQAIATLSDATLTRTGHETLTKLSSTLVNRKV